MICRLMQLLMQSNALIRERERACEYQHLCFSQVQQQHLLIMNHWFYYLATEKCHVAFQLRNYFIDKFAGQPQLLTTSFFPCLRVCAECVSVLCVRLRYKGPKSIYLYLRIETYHDIVKTTFNWGGPLISPCPGHRCVIIRPCRRRIPVSRLIQKSVRILCPGHNLQNGATVMQKVFSLLHNVTIEPLMADGVFWRCVSYFSGPWQCNLLDSQLGLPR